MKSDRPLTPRLAEIVNLAASGHTDKEIALIVGLSVGTLRTYWERLRQRYDARSRSEVIAKALLPPPVTEMGRYMLLKIPLFVWTVSPDGRVDYRNEWFEGVPESKSGLAYGPLLSPEDRIDEERRWDAARRAGQQFESLPALRRAPKGAVQAHKARVVPLRSEEGIILRWLGYARELAEDADERMLKFLVSILH